MVETLLTEEEQDQLIRSVKKARKVRIRPRASEAGQGESPEIITDCASEGGKRKLSYREMVTGDVEVDMDKDSDFPSEEEFSDDEEDVYSSDDVQFSKDQWKKFRAPWRSALIIKVLGKSFGFQFLFRRLMAIWRPKGEFKLISLNNDFFIVRLELKEDRERILFEGPWKILDYYLAVRRWTPRFRPSKATIDRAALWVRIPDCPMELYNETGMRGIGDFIGKTLKIDFKTQSGEMGNFARICVEVDLIKKLRSDFTIMGERLGIQYEGIHLVCFNCGKYGHKLEECPLREIPLAEDNMQATEGPGLRTEGSKEATNILEEEVQHDISVRKTVSIPEPSPGHGPWILGDNSKRKRGKRSRSKPVLGGSFGRVFLTDHSKYPNPIEDLSDPHTQEITHQGKVVAGQFLSSENSTGNEINRGFASWRHRDKGMSSGSRFTSHESPFENPIYRNFKDPGGSRLPSGLNGDVDPDGEQSDQEEARDFDPAFTFSSVSTNHNST